MNRSKRRSLVKRLKSHGYTDKQIFGLLQTAELKNAVSQIKEGDLVSLDIERITQDPNFDRKIPSYKQWVFDHKDGVFTVQYDSRHTDDPILVCFKEDTTTPKWMFFVGDLIKIGEG